MKIVSETSDSRRELLQKLVYETFSGAVAKDGEVIYSGRNTILRKKPEGGDVAIKIYGYTTMKSIIYMFRKTKARRAYENAVELLSRGIATPEPIAFGEERGLLNRLKQSVYISSYEETEPLADYLTDSDCIDEFARFVATLHDKGILHHDLNSTNVRLRHSGGKVTFSLIDINRMKFMPQGTSANIKDRFNNLTRFSSINDNYILFLKKYLKYANLPETLLDAAIRAKSNHDAKSVNIHKIKNIFRFNAKTK